MDKTSKKIINHLKEMPEPKYWFYDVEPHKELGISEEEFFRAVRYLAESGKIEYLTTANDFHIGITITHASMHSASIKFDSFKDWLFSTFLGGIITGVCSTLATEVVLYLGVKLLGLI